MITDPHNILAKVVALVEAELGEKITAYNQAEDAALKAAVVARNEKAAAVKERADLEAHKISVTRECEQMKAEAKAKHDAAIKAQSDAADTRIDIQRRLADLTGREQALAHAHQVISGAVKPRAA